MDIAVEENFSRVAIPAKDLIHMLGACMHVEQGPTDAPRSFELGGAPLQAAHGGVTYFAKVWTTSKNYISPSARSRSMHMEIK